jgi:hypothetical protein
LLLLWPLAVKKKKLPRLLQHPLLPLSKPPLLLLHLLLPLHPPPLHRPLPLHLLPSNLPRFLAQKSHRQVAFLLRA